MSFSIPFGSMWRELYLEVDVCIWSQKGYLSLGYGLGYEKVILQMLVFRSECEDVFLNQQHQDCLRSSVPRPVA